jgi:hypothetical protein
VLPWLRPGDDPRTAVFEGLDRRSWGDGGRVERERLDWRASGWAAIRCYQAASLAWRTFWQAI